MAMISISWAGSLTRPLSIGALVLIVSAQAALAAGDPVDSWRTVASQIDSANYFGETVANGMIGMLSSPQPFHTDQVLILGAFEPLWGGVPDGHPPSPPSQVRTFNFLDLQLKVDGVAVQRFDQVRNFRQEVDYRHAVLTTSFDYGDKLRVMYAIRALRHLPHVGLLSVRLEALAPVDIAVETRLDGSASFEAEPIGDIARYWNEAKLEGGVPIGIPSRSILMRAAEAHGPTGKITLAAAQTLLFDRMSAATPALGKGADGVTFTESMTPGSTFAFALVGATITSEHVRDPINEAQRMTANAAIQGEAALIRKHERAWDDLWQSDIQIEGDPTAQRDVHAMLYHLYSFIREGSGYPISPMGLSSSAAGYLGHLYWDSEMWTFPVLLALHPELARNTLDYRFERLGAAKANARRNGFRGAQFPWESAASGEEETWSSNLCGQLEVHVTADVAIAAWNYYRVTRDHDWLRERGWPLISATADFWTSRVTRNGQGHYDVEHVIGSDEYAEDVTNDAWTNASARRNLAIALEAARVLGLRPNPDWANVRENIPILKFPSGVTREYADYGGQKFKVADVSLLAYPLTEVSDPTAIRRDLDYYVPRIDHADGPAMLKSILSITYQRLGETDKAYALLRDGYDPNLRPPFGVMAETARGQNPYFATGAGGLLQSLIYGFGGLDLTDNGLTQRRSRLPKGWKGLRLQGIGIDKRTYEVR